MRTRLRLALLLAACAPAALAQLQLTEVAGGTERPVAAVFSLGSIDAGESAAALFRLRNTGTATVPFTPISVLGTAFLLIAAPQPATLSPQGAFDFTISFQPPAAGSYSATLQASGITVLLTGVAVPALTWQMITSAGPQPLGSPVDFGGILLGASRSIRFAVLNQTPQAMVVPAIAVSGADFKLDGDSPSGTLLQPLASASFAVMFTPTVAAPRSGSLAAGSHTYDLAGTGQAPPMPKASMTIDAGNSRSAQQGAVAVTLDAPSPVAASGTVSMSFAPAPGTFSAPSADPTIAFASGGLTSAFTVAAGDNRAYFGVQPSATFSTGTTAGTITFTLAFGTAASQQAVTIAPAAVGLTTVQATRQAASITVQAAGFDNTRSAGKLSFTFYDAAGNPIPPGTIAVDSSADFSNYFRGSALGGTFSLTAVFPVTGNSSQVAAFELDMTNAAGTARSGRVAF